MLKLDELIELAGQRGIPWKSKLVGLVLSVLVAIMCLGMAKFFSFQGHSLLLFGGVGCALGFLAWKVSCRIPRNKPNMVGVALAIKYETQDERKRIRADFIQEIAACLSRSEASRPFYVYEIPGYLAPNSNDIEGAVKFLKLTRGHLLIWGNLRTRKKGKTETFCLRLEGVISHSAIEQDQSKALAQDFRLAIPAKTEIDLADELSGFESTSDSISKGTQYIVALAAAISGDWAFARALLTELRDNATTPFLPKRISRKKKTKTKKIHQEAWQALVPERLATVCFAQAHENILRWIDNKTTLEHLVYAEEALDAFHAASPLANCPGYWVNKALIEVTLRKDLTAAEHLLNKCRSAVINDPIWRLSLAFVHVLKGSPNTALDLYDAALERDVPIRTFVDIEDYVQWWLEVNGGPDELYLLSALLNASGKHDNQLALTDLKSYEASSSFLNNSTLRCRAIQLRKELESQNKVQEVAAPRQQQAQHALGCS